MVGANFGGSTFDGPKSMLPINEEI